MLSICDQPVTGKINKVRKKCPWKKKEKSVTLKTLPNNDTVDKNLPDNAGDMGSIPGSGRSHKYKQLSLCTTTEPVL